MNDTNLPEPAWPPLLTSLAASLGLQPDPSQPLAAVEFVSGDHVAAILPHPTREDLVSVEVSLRGLSLDESDHERLLFLHRLNAAARQDHPWMISIDEEDVLLLSASFPWSGLTAETLSDLVAEGLERAESLDSLWQSLRKDASDSLGTLDDEPQDPTPLQLA